MNNGKKVRQSLSKSTSLFPKPSAEGMTSRNAIEKRNSEEQGYEHSA